MNKEKRNLQLCAGGTRFICTNRARSNTRDWHWRSPPDNLPAMCHSHSILRLNRWLTKCLKQKLLRVPRASPKVLVKKRGGGVRFCIDYRALTKNDVFLMPRIDKMLDQLNGNWLFYDPQCKNRQMADLYGSDFIRENGLHYAHWPVQIHNAFRVCNSPAMFQCLLHLILRRWGSYIYPYECESCAGIFGPCGLLPLVCTWLG